MKATELTLSKFLDSSQQLKVPVYQRTYSWHKNHCSQLWDDITRAANNKEDTLHFIGSIVTIANSHNSDSTPIKRIIDGQQRITTILLLVAALAIKLGSDNKHRNEELYSRFLINQYEEDELKYKLRLTDRDHATFVDIIEESHSPNVKATRLIKNFEFFKQKIEKEDAEFILKGVRRLMIVDISLEEGRDNPQLIFESLNSTGLGLTQSDLIRNYLLMGLKPQKQEKIYKDYWEKIQFMLEGIPGRVSNYSAFDRFVRDYLTMENKGNAPKLHEIYTGFKKYYVEQEGGSEAVDTVVSQLYQYAEYFADISLGSSGDTRLDHAFLQLNEFESTVTMPLLMALYDDYKNKQLITKDEFIAILDILGSYIFRRFVCGISSAGMNNFLPTLLSKTDKDDYFNSLKGLFLSATQTRRFPKDSEFITHLTYKRFDRKFLTLWLSRIENYGKKETISVANYTVEHIMPQTLTPEWKKALGDDWQRIHGELLHTSGNLTLTAYNPEMSNKTFTEKKAIKGGFDSSPLSLNASLQNITVWNEDAIRTRAKELAQTFIKVFPSVEDNS